jgi:hypothetical protein
LSAPFDCAALLAVKRWSIVFPNIRSSIAAALLAVLAILCADVARGQTFNFENDRVQMAELHGMWRFHTGDDPDSELGWADPGFNDSSWSLLLADQPWGVQGYKGYSGMAWYRFQVILPAKHAPMALFIPALYTSYQVFAEGRLIGERGGMPPHEKVVFSWANGSGNFIPLSSDLASGGKPLTIAIRVWNWPRWAITRMGGPEAAVCIGDARLLEEWRTLHLKDTFWSVSAQSVLLLVYLLAGFAGLGLFLLGPAEREYLWFAATEFLNAASAASWIYQALHPVWFHGFYGLVNCLQYVSGIFFLMFLVALLKEHRAWIYWIGITWALISALIIIPGELGWISLAGWVALGTLAWMPFQICVLLLLFLASKRANLDGRLLLGPVCLSYGAALVGNVLFMFFQIGHTGAEVYRQRFDHLFTWPFPASAQNIADFLMQISILVILVLRFGRTRRNEERQASELEAARTVQQVLVPEDVPAIPGFQIESVYKPAGQVGGDFFQIIPLPNGGLLAVIGDVSGKGMPAAMTVSLLVGTLRTLAHYTQSPGEILAAMNQRMLGRANGGFTTCLALHVDAAGSITAANAGHLSPYCNGQELKVESGLPLGLSAQSNYPEASFTLNTNQRLTLVTDGVVESRGKDGELFGFERTLAISNLPAEDIAKVAQDFGQDDDISVIALTRTDALVPAAA